MIIVDSPDTMEVHADQWRLEGLRIGFVPTMGNLHAGHLALVRKAQSVSDQVVVSVFVNPLQFDREDDLDAYPRSLEADTQLLEDVGVDVLFAPIEAEMYPLGRDAEPLLELPGLGRLAGDLEGAHRPGHFAGVVTVLKKLFDIVRPHVAVFGEKDFQQLRIVQHMVAEAAMPIEIVACETVREADGLAMSSRNRFLSDAEREIAPVLYRVLIGLRDTIRAKPGQLPGARKRALDQLQDAGFKTDYLEVRNADNLQPNSVNSGEKRVLAAVWLGNTRLIDNIKV